MKFHEQTNRNENGSAAYVYNNIALNNLQFDILQIMYAIMSTVNRNTVVINKM